MKRKEMAQHILDNHFKLMVRLYERWQDEKEYEDFDDYVDVVKSKMPETTKGTKRPFGFVVKCDDGLLHAMLKVKGNYLTLSFKEVKA